MSRNHPSKVRILCVLVVFTFCSGCIQIMEEILRPPNASQASAPRQTDEERARNAAARAEMEKAVAPGRIKSAQQMLNLLGYECGEATGVVDGRTRIAVIDYQFDQRLEITGWINESLVTHLETRVVDR